MAAVGMRPSVGSRRERMEFIYSEGRSHVTRHNIFTHVETTNKLTSSHSSYHRDAHCKRSEHLGCPYKARCILYLVCLQAKLFILPCSTSGIMMRSWRWIVLTCGRRRSSRPMRRRSIRIIRRCLTETGMPAPRWMFPSMCCPRPWMRGCPCWVWWARGTVQKVTVIGSSRIEIEMLK